MCMHTCTHILYIHTTVTHTYICTYNMNDGCSIRELFKQMFYTPTLYSIHTLLSHIEYFSYYGHRVIAAQLAVELGIDIL